VSSLGGRLRFWGGLAFNVEEGTFAWLHKDALIAKLDAEIDGESDDKAALSQTDRELRSAELMSDLLMIEREESALTWRAIAEQMPISFRADISPAALLAVSVVTKGNGHMPETSWMHGWDVVMPGLARVLSPASPAAWPRQHRERASHRRARTG
jgi:hypothetical protein